MPYRRPILGLAPVLAAVLLLASCDGGAVGGTGKNDAFDRVALLNHLGGALVVPSYEAFLAAAADLDEAVAVFASDPSPTTLADARAALRTARTVWQDASLFAFGPAEAALLRASLNTYPVDAARVEANAASGDYTLGAVSERAAAGFPALDYLLHGVAESDAGVVAAFADGDAASGRRTYLRDNAAWIRGLAEGVEAAWSAGGGDYLAAFAAPDRAGTDVGSSLGMLINAYVMHFERHLRDAKIGIPAGVRSAGVPRPTSTEAYYGGYSAALAAANLRAAQRLFLGTPHAGEGDGAALGLDDYLRAVDADALADEIAGAFAEAVAAVDAVDDPLSSAVERGDEAVLDAFREMQDVVVLLKADMASVLGVTVTYQDNDGD